jgi:hypothetical protein
MHVAWSLKTLGMGMYRPIWLTWLMTGNEGGLLWRGWWTFDFVKGGKYVDSVLIFWRRIIRKWVLQKQVFREEAFRTDLGECSEVFRPRAGRPRCRASIAGRDKRFVCSPRHWCPPSSYSVGRGGIFLGAKRLWEGGQFDPLTSSRAEIMNTWPHTPTLPICLHDAHRDNFALSIFLTKAFRKQLLEW